DARRRDDDVEAAEPLHDAVERGPHGGRVADVDRARLAQAAALAGPGAHAGRVLLLDVETDDLRAELRGADRDGFTNTRCAADDGRDLAREIENVLHDSRLLPTNDRYDEKRQR